MRINLPVTGVERHYPDGVRLISETTPKGVITYVNDDFCEVAGYSREELLGQAHNLIRHPDMPAEVYANFWETIKAGKPWMGIVKNRCKNGDHYWVSAYVTPLFDGAQMVGYQSVRTRPSRQQIERAERLYAHIRARGRLPIRLTSRLGTRAALTGLAGLLGGAGLGVGGASLPLMVLLPLGVLAAVAAAGIGYGLTGRARVAEAEARQIFDNAVGNITYGSGQDEVAALRLALAMERAQALTLLGRIEDFARQLMEAAQASDGAAAQTGDAVRAQQAEIEQVAAAMNQMSATVQEVSRNTAAAATAADGAAAESSQGKAVIGRAVGAMDELAAEVERAGQAIERLRGDSDQIRGVLEVIGGISEQTNLLALNAAIEAARAGDQGRGFAVVADEVRTLAQRAGEATKTIAEMIERLRQGAGEAVAVMGQGRQSARNVVALAGEAGEAIDAMEAAVRRISEMNIQMASATEEQSATAEEINRNLLHIRDNVHQTGDAAARGKQTSDRLVEMVSELQNLLRQFGRG